MARLWKICRTAGIVCVLINYFLLVSVLFVGCYTGVEGSSAEDQDSIIKNIILKIDASVRPVNDISVPVNVTLDITFNNIIEVDEKHQILLSSIWVRQMWTSDTTKWEPSEHGGIKEIVIQSSRIWQPDVVLYNNIFEEFDGRLDHTNTRVRLYSSGFVYWAQPFVFKTLCKIDVSDFPFDSQKCSITLGAWQYDAYEVALLNDKKTAALAKNRVENGEWTVEKVGIEKRLIYYQCCPNKPYPEMSFVIHMKRRPLFYVVNLILPNFLITLLAFFSFYIPVECGERISFVITVLLSMTVFLLLVAESIPPTSDAVPVIGIYYAFSIVEVFLALVATGISLKINYSYMFGDGLSPGLRSFLFKTLGPFLGFDVRKILSGDHMDGIKKRKGFLGRVRDLFGKRRRSPEVKLTEEEFAVFYRQSRGNMENSNNSPAQDFHFSDDSHVKCDDSAECGNSSVGQPKECEMLRRPGPGRDSLAMDVGIIASAVEGQRGNDLKTTESKLAAAIVDRTFLWIFVVFFITCSILILGIPAARGEY